MEKGAACGLRLCNVFLDCERDGDVTPTILRLSLSAPMQRTDLLFTERKRFSLKAEYVYLKIMNGNYSQAVTLVAHGNVFLARGGDPPKLETNTAFQYLNVLRFMFPESRSTKREHEPTPSHVAAQSAQPSQVLELASTADWLRHLKKSGIPRLWLSTFRRTLGIFAESTEAAWWWSKDVRDARYRINARGKRIWSLTYIATVADRSRPDLPEFSASRQEFARALHDAIQFAGEARQEHWRKLFESAYAQLDAVSPRVSYVHTDMLPAEGYCLEARQLLAAAATSESAFGGMGSWNDLLFDGALNEQYKRVSTALHGAVVSGIVAATNAFNSHSV